MSARLRAAIEEPAGRARRQAAVRDLEDWWRGSEGIGPLRAALDALPADGDAGTALGTVRPWLEDLGWIERGVARLVAAMRTDPLLEPPFRQVSHETQNGLRLLTHDAVTVTLLHIPVDRLGARQAIDPDARSILFSGRHSLLRVIRAGGATLDLWENDARQPCLAASAAGRCRPAGRAALVDGMVLSFDGARRSWTLAHAGGDIVLLQAIARAGSAAMMLEYEAGAGAFLAATMNDAAAARMQLIAGLLRRMARADAAPVVAGLIAGSPFHLRWQLMRELLAIDADLARPLLRDMAVSDPHAEVRAAAAATMELLAA